MDHTMKASANPTKEFFIDMITRDIYLKEAIIELIDNSIDGARRLKKDSNYEGLYIKIKFTKDKFVIEDNCGGIPLDLAKSTVFRFGRPHNANKENLETTGIFGIGMKRALFKIGRKFTISSIHKNSSFQLNLDVEKWVLDTNTNWDFPFANYDENDHSNEEQGTKIIVEKLFDGISTDFNSIVFTNELVNHITKRVSLEVENGILITVNEKEIIPEHIEIIDDEIIKPIKESFIEDGVYIRIVAGISKNRVPFEAGWYIYCNGRLIVAADKSALTTWRDIENINNGIAYHNDYAAFRGFVFFNSESPEKLPWNTTKTGIDESSPVYIFTKQKMLNIFNIIKPLFKEINSSDPSDSSDSSDSSDNNITLDKMKAVIINNSTIKSEIKDNTNLNLATLRVKYIDPEVTITYKKPKIEVDLLKNTLGATSNKEVGIMTFDYYKEAECE